MKRKLGPLQLWQWILIGAVVGAGTYFYRRQHPAAAAAQDAAAAALPSDAAYNPIDPTTGLPFAGGMSTGPALDATGDVTTTAGLGDGTGGGSLSDLLTNFGTLEDLLTGLTGLTGIAPGPETQTDQGAVQEQVGTKRASTKKAKKKTPKAKKTVHAGTKNPGHHITSHGHGRKTPSSSAPHNPRQHHNVRPPAHQRHPATQHHSAKHPAAKHLAPAHHTPIPPAARPKPAPRPRRRRRR